MNTTRYHQTFLETFHDQTTSLRKLHKYLRGLKVKRRHHFTCTTERDKFVEVITQELNGPGHLLGYCLMTHKLRTCYDIAAQQNVVMNVLQESDPGKASLRGYSYGGELARLSGLARLSEISPSLRNSYKNIMCSYKTWASPPRWDLTWFYQDPT